MAVIGEPQKEYEMHPLKMPVPPQYEPDYVPSETPQHVETPEQVPA